MEGVKKTNQAISAQKTIPISNLEACLLHLISIIGLAASFWIANNIYTIDILSHTVQTLRLICIVQLPISVLLYSLYRLDPRQCHFLTAVARGALGLFFGALSMAFGAIVLGAPIGIPYLWKTIYWSLLMSVFTVVPAACVYGSSWKDWQRLFAYTKLSGTLDYIISIPAHGAVMGAWVGAWPMPLDWERPWQEWPICVSCGAIAGYVVGIVASIGFVFIFNTKQSRVKRD
ncbi:hypothetical protein ACHQM5_001472 [Ranunculus cassubicifolius]